MTHCDQLIVSGIFFGKKSYWCKLYSSDFHYISAPGGCTRKFHPACYQNKQSERKEKLMKIQCLV